MEKEHKSPICSVCGQNKNKSDLTSTYILTKQNKEKDVQMCQPCIERVCDMTIGEWFLLQSTDEMAKLPAAFYTKS